MKNYIESKKEQYTIDALKSLSFFYNTELFITPDTLFEFE